MAAAARPRLDAMISRRQPDPGTCIPAGQWPRRPARTPLVAATALAVLFLAASCATVSHGHQTVRGHQVVLIIPDAENTSIVFPDVAPGTPVTVRDGHGHRIGSGELAFNDAATTSDWEKFNTDPENGGNFVAVFDFTVTVPAGLPRYGVTVGTGHGVAWFSAAQMLAGPVLTIGSLQFDTGGGPLTCSATSRPELVSGPCADAAGGYQYVPHASRPSLLQPPSYLK
jgi:hypothetical protein